MTARIASGRLAQSALQALHPRPRPLSSALLPIGVHRDISSGKAKNNGNDDISNPILEQYLKKKAKENHQGTRKPPAPRQGGLSLSPSSFLLPEREIPEWRDDMSPEQKKALKEQHKQRQEEAKKEEQKALMDMTLDPNPEARKRLERRLVIASVKRHGRMTKAQKLARTERESLYKSHFLPTSTKKLQKVVNQIAGKTVSEALVQLRFSKKKVARDVIKGLEIAQNEAIAARGLGLAGESMAVARWEKQRNATDAGRPKDIWDYQTSEDKSDIANKEPKVQFHKDTLIQLKDGSKKIVRDPSEIYIDQAWVGPGASWSSVEFRARGATNRLKHRTTSFSVVLKEEKTRMRISDEIKKKRDNRKLWVALPDRPVTSQRQYCLW